MNAFLLMFIYIITKLYSNEFLIETFISSNENLFSNDENRRFKFYRYVLKLNMRRVLLQD